MSENNSAEKERRLSVASASPRNAYITINASYAHFPKPADGNNNNHLEVSQNNKQQRSLSCSPNMQSVISHTQLKESAQKEKEKEKKNNTMASSIVTGKPENVRVVQTGMDRYLKRKSSPAKGNKNKITKNTISDEQLKPMANNRFALLDDEQQAQTSSSTIVSITKPPPIYLRERSSNTLVNKIAQLIGENNFHISPIRRGNIHETKIQTNTESGFRAITSGFDVEKRSYYTYRLKSSKGLVIVLKGIEQNVDPNDIKSALEGKGYRIKSVVNILNRLKISQPLFKVELEPDARKLRKNEVHPIYKENLLLHRRISVEEPHKRNGPVQCQNCQEYGHTKAYCTLPTVCVVCGDLHHSARCTVQTQAQKKCSNCGGNHTANYRGCEVYKTLKKKLNVRLQTVRNKNEVTPEMEITQEPVFAQHNGENSYARVLKATTQNVPVRPMGGLESMIQQLTQSLNMFMSTMQSMMQEFMRNQNQLIQALLSKK